MSPRRDYADKPGSYDRVAAWLADHPGATLNDMQAALGVSRDRALLCLRHGMATRAVRRYRASARTPWRWYRTGDGGGP